MDALSEVLRDVRPHGAVFDRSLLSPPWSVRFSEQGPLAVAAMVRGRAWITPEGGAPVGMGTGDIAVVAGADRYVISDAPGTAPRVLVDGDGRCVAPDGCAVGPAAAVCAYGDEAGASSLLIRATYDVQGSVCERVGYANAYALSVAFERVHGVRPSEHRAGALAPADPPGADAGHGARPDGPGIAPRRDARAP